MATLPPPATMRRAYLKSDDSYDGLFFLGVRTTGVFCRPSCGARKPKPANVEFFATAREAVFAGYRPCRRCLPMAAVGSPPAWVSRLLETVDRSPAEKISDASIRSLGIDPARARRYFQRTYGMTFLAYCRGRRLGRALEQIRRGDRLDDVALGHGYESHSGFRDAFGRVFGRPPGKSRSTDCLLVTWIQSPLGPLVAGAKKDRLVLLEFTDRRMLERQFETLRRIFRTAIVPGENRILEQTRNELAAYFAGTLRRFTVPLDSPGTPFQQEVWSALRRVPYGGTISYEELARKIGAPEAQRAVGNSNGLNRLAIVVPCHRVVRKDGTLGGYGGGIWRKQALLELERGERSFSGTKEPGSEEAPPAGSRAGARPHVSHGGQT